MIISSEYEDLSEAARIDELNKLIAEWREPGFVRVPPVRVIPCTTNRDGTGLSSYHLHHIASNMVMEGFTAREHASGTGHDLPLLVRERITAPSELGMDSLAKWQRASAANAEQFPPLPAWAAVDAASKREDADHESPNAHYFCSLGNGHFFQALNLIRSSARCKFFDEPPDACDPRPWPEHYSTTAERHPTLHAAIHEGVEAVILRPDMPKAARKFVSQMLNAAYEYKWVHDAHSGAVSVNAREQVRAFTSFEGMVKHADAWQLDEIVEMHMRREAKELRKKHAYPGSA